MSHFLIVLGFLAFGSIVIPFAIALVKGIFGDSSELAEANQRIGAFRDQIEKNLEHMKAQDKQIKELQGAYEKLQFQKVSADVKLGQKSEHLLPFLQSFPYKDDEIKGLFQPVDLIVFRDDEVVFVEVKTGAAQLSEKERRIRDNIKAGRVRFEVHRINEKGVTVK